MLWFYGRKRNYIELIGLKLSKEFKIEPDESQGFPSAVKYSKLIEASWASKMNADEAAMQIAVSYFLYLCKGGSFVDASEILLRIENIVGYEVPRNLIREEYRLEFSNAIIEGRQILGIK
ncbi:hypothetical protein [Pseudomonas sp. BMW13]|jgi:hypothetical protein|uniref:hypothetical protein n=1 Tax=Pseudomonas sp. BMW13 TaxID=2562590 RepID=UPI00158413BE|nr:hypothetical protein [Pseudomonas sp. BMW13]|tara:strand:+ start:141 stop:500 length:360 start_codon:yes stop_codon:yes gene_type:complete